MRPTICRVLLATATFLIGATSHHLYDRPPSSKFDSQFVPITFRERDELPQRPQQLEPEVVFDYDPAEFNPRGDYFILGRKPKEFREFVFFEIAVDEHKISGRVMITTYENDEYNAILSVSGIVNELGISLVAKPMFEEDAGYRIEGEFLRQGEVWRAGKSEAVLKARLTKIKGGQTIAEAEVKFRIQYLGC